MPISNIVCITPEIDDNPDSFGCSIAINNKYLAIGDCLANRVVIYTHRGSNQWERSRVLLPPPNSIPEQFNHGFGDSLELDGDFLIISASIQTHSELAKNLEGFLQRGSNIYYFDERYLINLDKATEITPIGLPVEKNGRLVTFNLLSQGKVRRVTLPNNGEIGFGTSFAYHDNLLLVGSPSYTDESGAWLYDIDQLDREPEKLAIPNIYLGKTLAINEQFAVVSDPNYQQHTYIELKRDIDNLPKSTLIKAIKTDSMTTLHRTGALSLSGDILAIMYPFSNYFVERGFLELYRLSENIGYKLISTRGQISKGFVQNGFLITAFNNYELARQEINVQKIV